MNNKFEPVIGLEIHVELKTKSKMFCRCSADYFGEAPNTHTCPVCLGMPGALPVINKDAIEKAIVVGLALNCKVNNFSKFDRKHYFYPDLPKGYQISQYDLPINGAGHLDINVDGKTKRVGITRAHQEEDAGKLTHSADATLVDLNRAGVPLLEIVSDPDMHSAKEARTYAQKIQQIVRYTGVSDCDMEKGSMRADANISVRPVGETKLPPYKVEVKNMNTFKGIERAIEFEIARQIELREKGEIPAQETRGWDETKGKTFSQRTKEEAQDYRYFPDPDLPPIKFDNAYIESLRKKLPELPDAKAKRFMSDYKLSDKDVETLTADRMFADFFEEAVQVYARSGSNTRGLTPDVRHEDVKKVANWMLGEMLRRINEANLSVFDLKLSPAMLAELLYLLDKGEISGVTAKDIFANMFETGTGAAQIIQQHGLTQISNEDEIKQIVEKVTADNPKAVADYKAGKEASLMFLIGQIMKETKGKADNQVVKKLLLEKLAR